MEADIETMRTKICLFLDYLSVIPLTVKTRIISQFQAEIVDDSHQIQSEFDETTRRDFSIDQTFQYKETILELRRAFSAYTPNVIQAALIGEGILDLSRFLTPRSLEFINSQRESRNRNITNWALNINNWFLINSETPSYELQSQISSEFPALVFENIPIECSSTKEPDVTISNLDDILQSCGVYQLWERNNFGDRSEIVLLDTGISTLKSSKHNINPAAISSLNSVDSDGHGTAIAELVLSICPQANITSIKILNSFTDGNIWNFISGLTSLYNKQNSIVNLSIGVVPTYLQRLGPSLISFKESIVNITNSAASQRNFLIAAAGNDNIPELRWPAAANSVLAVGSHNLSFQLSSFSNYANSQNFILSLGGDLRKYDNKIEGFGRYGLGLSRDIFGTSFSTAIVTGISGLLMSYPWFSEMSVSSRISLFRNHCRKNESGYPILNVSDVGAIWPL